MARLTNYSPAVDLAYAQYHAALLASVTDRNNITTLSKNIGQHSEAVPDATRVNYDDIDTLLKSVEKLMYPVSEDWSEKISFGMNRFATAGVREMSFEDIVAYIKAAEQLHNHSVSQGMEAAVKVTLDALVSDGTLTYSNGMYSLA